MSVNSNFWSDLGVFGNNKKVNLYHCVPTTENGSLIKTAVSTNGFVFKSYNKNPEFIDKNKKPFLLETLTNIRFSTSKDTLFFFTGNIIDHNEIRGIFFISKDGKKWYEETKLPFNEATTLLSKPYQTKGYLAFTGNNEISLSNSTDLKKWSPIIPILSPRSGFFDCFPLQIGNAIFTESGILVTYYVTIKKREGNHILIGAALFATDNPSKQLWRTQDALWEEPKDWDDKKINPLGAVRFKNKLIFYFGEKGKAIYAISHPSFDELLSVQNLLNTPKLSKILQNPIITPVLQHYWESQATFNTAAINVKGRVHFLYRAIGTDNTSVLGYAASKDGLTVNERLTEPAYIPREPFELPNGKPWQKYRSGGGYGGCEDPRLTKIGDTLYLTYIAFNGYNPPRIALSSIPYYDFLDKKWNWSKPQLISKPGVVDKNAVIFPEKLRGKYVIMHRVFPNILIDFVDELNFKGTYLKDEYSIFPRRHSWDSRKIGAGAPPIKTDKGWLLIYHAVDDRNDSQYKIGAMLLDLHNPLKILYWSREPIIVPDMWYDNLGYKSGVVYPCGAVIKDNNLIVYYGGADSVVCAAKQPLDTFLDLLIKSSKFWPKEEIPLRTLKTVQRNTN